MEKRLIPAILSDQQWFYNLATGYLHLDASGHTGTFSTKVLSVTEKEQLEDSAASAHNGSDDGEKITQMEIKT